MDNPENLETSEPCSLYELLGLDTATVAKLAARGFPMLTSTSHGIPPEEQAADCLSALFYPDLREIPGTAIEMRTVDQKTGAPGPRDFFTTIAEAVEFAMANREAFDVYVGVGLRLCPVTGDMETCECVRPGADDHVLSLPAAWSDLDVTVPGYTKGKPKPYASQDAVIAALNQLDPNQYPRILVSTGGGIQAYWTFGWGKATPDLERVIRINRALNERLQGDPGANSKGRVLRVPGTFNHKYGEPRPVGILRMQTALSPTVDELERLFSLPPIRPLATWERPDGRICGWTEQQKRFLAAEEGRHLRTLDRRDWEYADMEPALAALATAMVEHGLTDGEALDLFIDSGPYDAAGVPEPDWPEGYELPTDWRPQQHKNLHRERYATFRFERALLAARLAQSPDAPGDGQRPSSGDSDGAVTDRYPARLQSLRSALDGKFARILDYADASAYGNDTSCARQAIIGAMVKRHFTDGEIVKTLDDHPALLNAFLGKKRGETDKRFANLIETAIEQARDEVTPFDTDPGAPELLVTAVHTASIGTSASPSGEHLADPAPDWRKRFRLLTPREILLRPDPEYQIDGILQRNSLAMVVGPPGVCKSFLMHGQAFDSGAGRPWLGVYRTRQTSVLYISAEGGDGLKKRIRAWQTAYGIEVPDCCYFIEGAVKLPDTTDVQLLLALIADLPSAPGLVYFDTLNRCAPGADENSAKDMGEVIAAGDAVREATGACVVFAHHPNKSGGIRGSTAIIGALDTIIEVRSDSEAGPITVKCLKQKDAAPFAPLTLARRIVTFPDGGGSLVLELDHSAASVSRDPLTPQQHTVLGVLQDTFRSGGATWTQWRDACAALPEPIKESPFGKAMEILLNVGAVTKVGIGKGAHYYPATPFEAADK